ncbi:hypothetical protein CSW98_15680 [Vibrio sp. HA2012]|nr:hypothetical protein CSW98_15680 [Vibrio sp. HA2012]
MNGIIFQNHHYENDLFKISSLFEDFYFINQVIHKNQYVDKSVSSFILSKQNADCSGYRTIRKNRS